MSRQRLEPKYSDLQRYFPKEMKIVLGNPWFKDYGRRSWYFAFFMNYCIFRVFEDNYRDKYVGINQFLDAMNKIVFNNFYGDAPYHAVYMAAKRIYPSELHLESLLAGVILPAAIERISYVGFTWNSALIRVADDTFCDHIRYKQREIYDHCLEELKREPGMLYGKK